MSASALSDLQGCRSPHLPDDLRPSRTTLLVEQLATIPDAGVQRVATRIARCAAKSGWRCQSASLCPRCGARLAKRRRRQVEAWLRAVDDSRSVLLVTLTLGSAYLASGIGSWRDSFGQLRRRVPWRGVEAGRGQIEIVRCLTGDRRWLVHGHVLALLRDGSSLDEAAVSDAWAGLLGAFPGRAHFEPVTRRWTSRARTFLAGRLLRFEAPLRVARARRRGPRGGRAGSPRCSPVGELRVSAYRKCGLPQFREVES
jgi:hypothetical protein